MLIHQYLEIQAKKNPEKMAVIFESDRISYGEINIRAENFAKALIKAGMIRGDRIVIFLDNSIETIIGIYGILKAGGIFSVVSPLLKEKKLEYILNNSEAKFLVTHKAKLDIINNIYNKAQFLKSVIIVGLDDVSLNNSKFISWSDFLNIKFECSLPQIIDIDLAYIIYTSGSTAEPKGVMMTHLNIRSAATSIIEYLQLEHNDIILNVLPLSFDYGLYQIIMAFISGGTIVLEKSFLFPNLLLDRIINENITIFPIVPTLLSLLFQMKNIQDKNLSSVKTITNTGSAIPVNYILKCNEIFPNAEFYSMYGLTECKRVSFLPPEQLKIRPDSVGKGMPNEEVYIVDENGNQVGPNVIGELVVRGANVMKGYWKDPEETSKRLKPGSIPNELVLYTGDYFKMDDEGYLYFVARKDDMIKTRGERVSPKEIESTLYEIDGVLEAAVIGVPDPILGNAIKAFIVLDNESSVTTNFIQAYCKDNLESFMVPKHIEYIKQFDRTSTGKIDKKQLK